MIKKHLKYLIIPSLAIVAVLFSGNAFAECDGASFCNPLGQDTVEGVLGKVLTSVQGVVAGLAVLMLVVAGVIYITSAGNEGQITLAKKAVTAALIGLVLTLAAPSFLKEIYTALGTTDPSPSGTKTLSEIIANTISIVAGLVGSLSVLMLVIGGVMYITAGVNEKQVETARNTIKYAIIGLVVAITALIIVTQVVRLF